MLKHCIPLPSADCSQPNKHNLSFFTFFSVLLEVFDAVEFFFLGFDAVEVLWGVAGRCDNVMGRLFVYSPFRAFAFLRFAFGLLPFGFWMPA